MTTKIREIVTETRLIRITTKDKQARRNIYWKYKLTSTTHLQKWTILKNCMLEFLKQQEILRKKEMEKFENQTQEDLEKIENQCQRNLERHQKELEQ